MTWTYVSTYAFGDEKCLCTRSRGDSANCPVHRGEYALRQTGCSCWAGWHMPDGSRVDPQCTAHDDDGSSE